MAGANPDLAGLAAFGTGSLLRAASGAFSGSAVGSGTGVSAGGGVVAGMGSGSVVGSGSGTGTGSGAVSTGFTGSEAAMMEVISASPAKAGTPAAMLQITMIPVNPTEPSFPHMTASTKTSSTRQRSAACSSLGDRTPMLYP